MPEMNNPVHSSQSTYINPLHESAVQENSSPTSTIGQTALKEIKDAGSTLRGKAFEVREMSVKMGRAVGNFFSKTIPTFAKGFVTQNKVDHEQKREALVAKLEARIAQQKDNPKAVKDINNIINKVMVMTDNELDDTASVSKLIMGAYKNEGLAEQSAVNVVRKVTAAALTEQPSHLRKLSDKVAATFDKADFKPMTRLDRIGRALTGAVISVGAAPINLALRIIKGRTPDSKGSEERLLDFRKDVSKMKETPVTTYKSVSYREAAQSFLNKAKDAFGYKPDTTGRKVQFESHMKDAFKPQTAWEVEIDPNKTYQIGNSTISGARILELQKETRVSVDTSVVNDQDRLAHIMRYGSENIEDRMMASGKIVSSTEILMRSASGEDLGVNGDTAPTFRAYTIVQPNVAYDGEMKVLYQKDGKLDLSETGKYATDTKRTLKHLLSECKKDGVDIPIIPAAGLYSYMPAEDRPLAANAFVRALIDAKKEGKTEFEEIVLTGSEFNNIPTALRQEAQANGINIVGGKDSTAVLEKGIKAGKKMGMTVAGDPSGQAGQQAALKTTADFAQEESFAINVPTFMLNQNYGANKAVGSSENYQDYP